MIQKNNINVNELSVGNLIGRPSQPEGFIVDGSTILNICNGSEAYKDVYGLLLTPEWCESLGLRQKHSFKKEVAKIQYAEYWITDDIYIELERFCITNTDKIILGRCPTVHKLQNWYRLFANQELNIQPVEAKMQERVLGNLDSEILKENPIKWAEHWMSETIKSRNMGRSLLVIQVKSEENTHGQNEWLRQCKAIQKLIEDNEKNW